MQSSYSLNCFLFCFQKHIWCNISTFYRLLERYPQEISRWRTNIKGMVWIVLYMAVLMVNGSVICNAVLWLVCLVFEQELIQNADDAGASEVVFIHDERAYEKDSLWSEDLGKYQGNQTQFCVMCYWVTLHCVSVRCYISLKPFQIFINSPLLTCHSHTITRTAL